MKKRLLALGLALTFLLSLTACASQEIQAEELTAGVHTENHSGAMDFDGPETLLVNDFAVRLFQQTMAEGENTLLSPISVLSALAMAANGAQGETLTQMEEAFGLSVPALNNYMYCWETCLENYKATVKWANSLWLKTDSIQVEENFLQSCIQWYEAEVYEAPFDQTTGKDLNLWVEENTDGMIKDMISELSSDTVLCLVNTLAFDAEWKHIYYDFQVKEDVFTQEDGTRQEGEFMYSDEEYYWEDEFATGVMKYYEGDVYAFVGLLPKEGVNLEEYVESLSGEALKTILTGFQNAEVSTKLPKFRTETTADLIPILQSMGMIDLFDPVLADLSGMGSTSTGMLYINQVLHKTFINVDEKGTQAGAATMVAAGDGAEAPHEVKQVHLDRPFLYMIVDTRKNLPLFIGTMTDMA